MAPDRDTLLRWAVRHRVRADELRMKGKDRWAENNDDIRRQLGSVRQKDLAKQFGVHLATIGRIAQGRSWAGEA